MRGENLLCHRLGYSSIGFGSLEQLSNGLVQHILFLVATQAFPSFVDVYNKVRMRGSGNDKSLVSVQRKSFLHRAR